MLHDFVLVIEHICLIVKFALFQISHLPIFTTSPDRCRIIGVLQHYFWLTCFLIMASISIDFAYRFSNICKPWYMKKGKISMWNLSCCWILGLVLMAIPTYLDNLTELPITYGASSGICFIEPRQYLIGFFIGPSFFLFFINAICFLSTIVNICRILPHDMEIAAASDRNMAMIFAKIGGLMGVTWLFALVPYITGIEEFWYVFVVMNGLQGLYIFLVSGTIDHLRKILFQNERPRETSNRLESVQETTF